MNRLPLFPDTTKIERDALTIAGQDVAFLAEKYGTPLYLYDQATMDNAVACYKDALASTYPKSASVTYAGKAWLSVALAQWTQRHNLWLDCTGEGEVAIARAGSVPREHILVHGVNKSNADLEAAVRFAGTIVVDNLSELARLATLFPNSHSPFPHIWLRLQPGLAVDTHAYTQTGQHDSKFGMTCEEILEAAESCRQHNLPLKGIHFHQGSNFRDPEPLIPAIDLALNIAEEINFPNEWHFSPGGGWGVAYHEQELPHPSIEGCVRGIVEAVMDGCQTRRLDLPHLHLEPGRSLVARAGMAIYRVGAVKRRANKTWILTDGGMADNPRYPLYGARYSCLPVNQPGREQTEHVAIGGPYCESGDLLIENLLMPKVEEGELLAVPMSGAYQLSMSSNYNGARRPAVVWLGDNEVQLIQRREMVEDLLRRDAGLPG